MKNSFPSGVVFTIFFNQQKDKKTRFVNNTYIYLSSSSKKFQTGFFMIRLTFLKARHLLLLGSRLDMHDSARYKVSTYTSLLDNALNYLVGCVIRKRK